MSLRESFSDQLKSAMKAGDAARVSSLRLILAKLKEADIAARPKGMDKVPDQDILTMLRAMVKSRREAADLYHQGKRPELAAKEEAEIGVIESFLPAQMDDAALDTAVSQAIVQTGAAGIRDMGKVMAALKEAYPAALDMARAGKVVKARLGG